jgi:hypothetical protein
MEVNPNFSYCVEIIIKYSYITYICITYVGLLPALFSTMSRDKSECRCMYTPEKGTNFIDTTDGIKGENDKVDDPIKRKQIS